MPSRRPTVPASGLTRPRAEIHNGPTVAGDVVYVRSYDGHLYAFDAASGDLLWRFGTREPWGSGPAAAEGLVLFGASDAILYALE